ncbi:hypothetical protein HNR23_002269 [Nocardiopsis mwathae]|uniref:Uncharacterized protein n=1 Tax=Nocardiopsis mwathae TaxID=1472723 RepID=A0A7W9YHF1_9ACTN|nr:hypothetical protein [Nocardiopsis mwathae]MBB6172209.1 hypothetical protein [Nocardiopsis mwathae]
MTIWPGDLTTAPDYELQRLHRLWASDLYPAVRDMLSTIPKAIHLPRLDPNTAKFRDLDDACHRVERALEKLENRNSGLPADLHPVLVRAMRDTSEAASALGVRAIIPWWNSPYGRNINRCVEAVMASARSRAKAVAAFSGWPDADEAAYWDDRLEQITDHV